MMATVRHVTAWAGLRKFQPDGFCWTECTNSSSAVCTVFQKYKTCSFLFL